MCKAEEYIVDLNNLFLNIENDWKFLNSELSRLDKMQDDLLHQIEFQNFNAAQGYKLAKVLKTVRNQRRIVKNEIEIFHSLRNITRTCFKRLESSVRAKKRNHQKAIYHPKVIKTEAEFTLLLYDSKKKNGLLENKAI